VLCFCLFTLFVISANAGIQKIGDLPSPKRQLAAQVFYEARLRAGRLDAASSAA
jgi:hypothetical protein